jgi:uncharacterized iron-regulated protein
MASPENIKTAPRSLNDHTEKISRRFGMYKIEGADGGQTLHDADGDGRLLDDILRSNFRTTEKEGRIIQGGRIKRAAGGRYVSGLRAYEQVTTRYELVTKKDGQIITKIDFDNPNRIVFKLDGQDWFALSKNEDGSFEYRELLGKNLDVITYNNPKLGHFFRFGLSGFHPKFPTHSYSTFSTPIVTASGTLLGDAYILKRIIEADIILVGGCHGNRLCHSAQDNVIRFMIKHGVKFGIALGVLPVTQQSKLDEFNKGNGSISDLRTDLNWDRVLGSFHLYEPVFKLARAHSFPLAGINVPKDLVSRYSRKGRSALSPNEIKLLPEKMIPPRMDEFANLQAMAATMARKDRSLGGVDMATRIVVRGQALRCTAMAEEVLDLQRSMGKVVVFAPSGQISRGWGMPTRIRAMANDKKMLLISPYPGADLVSKPSFAEEIYYTEK